MASAYPPETRYREHKDWFPDEVSNDREITLLLYLNPDWNDDDGGCLAIHDMDDAVHAIAPKPGRLVVFLSRLLKHEIRVNTAERRRVTLQLWLDRAKPNFTFVEQKTFLDDLEDPLAFAPDDDDDLGA